MRPEYQAAINLLEFVLDINGSTVKHKPYTALLPIDCDSLVKVFKMESSSVLNVRELCQSMTLLTSMWKIVQALRHPLSRGLVLPKRTALQCIAPAAVGVAHVTCRYECLSILC